METVQTGISEVRIGSAAKGQRHETRPEELELIAKDVHVEYQGANLFDGSCAHGEAVAYLGEQWGCTTWGNEIEKKGYEGAAKMLDHATHGPQESLDVDGYFDIFFCNPPYDQGARTRLEIEHVEQNIEWLRAYGVGIAVLPEAILRSELFWQKWHTNMIATQVRKYPEPEFSRFEQYVVYGEKASSSGGRWHEAARLANEYANRDWSSTAVLGERPVTDVGLQRPHYYHARDYPQVRTMSNSLPQGEQLVGDLAQMPTIFDIPEWQLLTRPPMDPQRSNPAMPLRAGHIVQVGAAGMFHGQEMVIDGKPYMVTGGSYKWTHVYTVTDENREVTHHVEKPAYKIGALSLTDGHFLRLDSHKGQAEYANFLQKTTGPLIEAVNRSYPPRYQMDYSRYVDRFNQLHGPRVLPGREANGLLTAQKHTAAAILEIFEEHKAAILVGEMGCGKTSLSIATMAIQNAGSSLTAEGQNWRIVVMAPAVVAPKWVEEAERILQDVPNFEAFLIGREVKQAHQVPVRPGSMKAGLANLGTSHRVPPSKAKIRKPILDAQNAMAHDGPAMLVLTYEIAKNGSPWEHTAIKKRKIVEWQEEVPSYTIYGEVGTKIEWHEEEVDVFYCPDCFQMLLRTNEDGSSGGPWTMGKAKGDEFCTTTAYAVKRRCPHCGGFLYQDVPFKKGGRFAVAEYLSQNYGGQYSLILDECFPGDTPVATPEGSKPIEDIRVGNLVLSEKDGQIVPRRVIRTIEKPLAETLVKVTHSEGYLICTPNHKIYVNGSPVRADSLHPGDQLTMMTRGDGPASGIGHHPVCVLSIEPVEADDIQYVYNLEVEDTHNYFADNILVSNCHNSKGGETNIGMASQDLISGATKVIAMTGTIFNGYARSLFHLMYRLNPQFRKLYEHDDGTRFAQQHGYADTVVTKSTRKSSAYGYSGDVETTRVDEAPGASPQMVAMLMPYTVFLTLDDIGIELPPYEEIAVPVEMSEALQDGYRKIKGHESDVKYQFMQGNRGPLATWVQAMLGWLDYAKKDVFDAPDITPVESELLPKDQTLVNLVEENLNEGRGVAVFFEQVNRRPAMERVQAALEREGIYAFTLRVNIAGEERMPFIEEQTRIARAKGHEPVMLANGSLIKEGVDLLDFPTICEVGQHYNINALRQRLRRSWRLGQTKPVDIYFLYYQGTKQADALIHIAKKLRAAKQVDGQVAAGIATFEMDESDFVQELMAQAEDIAGGKLAELMQTRAFSDVELKVRRPTLSKPALVKAEPLPTFIPPRPGQVVQLSLF